MAKRPVFRAISKAPYYETVEIEFEFYSGFSVSQKQKSIRSLHASFLRQYPTSSVLEISSKSEERLGVNMSAFNLILNYNGNIMSVESAFQGSKVFRGNVQYTDIYNKSSIEAKKDIRLKESGPLEKFRFFGMDFPLEPKNYFYNWLYIMALSHNAKEYADFQKYDAFTDIEFNPERSLNCQAMAAAQCVGLIRAQKIDLALQSKEKFYEVAYGSDDEKPEPDFQQMSIFDIIKNH